MSLRPRLQEDLKGAMREGDATTRDTLRLLIAALANRRIELGRELEEAEELAVLQKAVKSREDSAAQYADAGRDELAAAERAEIEVVRRYLPAGLDEDETRALVRATIDAQGLTSKAELGKLMKAVMAEHRGRIDGKLVQRIAGEMLG